MFQTKRSFRLTFPPRNASQAITGAVIPDSMSKFLPSNVINFELVVTKAFRMFGEIGQSVIYLTAQ